jgi:hypothetical protein
VICAKGQNLFIGFCFSFLDFFVGTMKIKILEQWKNIETIKLIQNYKPTTYIFEDSNLNVRAEKVW